MRRMCLAALILVCLGSLTVRAQQTPDAPPAFAVATIKASHGDAAPVTQIRGNTFATEGTTFVDVFKYAYNIHPDQVVGGPEWLRSSRFDIVADPETAKRPSSDQMKALVRQLLTDRFHLAMHQEKKVLPVYELVKANEEPKLTRTATAEAGIPVAGFDPRGELQVGNATMGDFARFLQRFVLDRPAIDHTGISGRFDLTLRWTPDDASADLREANAAPSLFTAIKEQLGLRLQPVKAETDVFVIDHVERPSEN